ncbi:hypothetical protein HOLleu_27437 [Holothuria leucospilota]|uniref:Uncharacterized protein n=1 Tax=Holothuria leucospilota TaxID=206669 RepID=A0A9Q1BQF7_HOLLE|nr:hypothetical protein HOLleu_27437 [Holothuria leucospilota]
MKLQKELDKDRVDQKGQHLYSLLTPLRRIILVKVRMAVTQKYAYFREDGTQVLKEPAIKKVKDSLTKLKAL